MFAKYKVTKWAAFLFMFLFVLEGCTTWNNNATNRTKQQGVRMQQTATNTQRNTDNRVQIANQAADRIVKLGTVTRANVLVTRRNAYVAATVHTNQGQLTRQMEDQIAQQVRATDPNIQNVYVSTNPEFADRVNRYVTDVSQGRPVSGFAQEFSEMIQRIFPNAR